MESISGAIVVDLVRKNGLLMQNSNVSNGKREMNKMSRKEELLCIQV